MPLPPWTADLPTLYLLVAVAELGSVGRAAQAHLISQPSASARLLLDGVGGSLAVASGWNTRPRPGADRPSPPRPLH